MKWYGNTHDLHGICNRIEGTMVCPSSNGSNPNRGFFSISWALRQPLSEIERSRSAAKPLSPFEPLRRRRHGGGRDRTWWRLSTFPEKKRGSQEGSPVPTNFVFPTPFGLFERGRCRFYGFRLIRLGRRPIKGRTTQRLDPGVILRQHSEVPPLT